MGNMGNFLFLAAEAVHSEMAEGAAEGGFGLNLDILETNLINLVILIGILFYFGRNVLTNILNERRSTIESAIQDAESRLSEAKSSLTTAEEQLKQAQQEAQRIVNSAQEKAEAAKTAILAQAEVDVQKLQATAAADLNAERDRAIAQLKQQVVALALKKAESRLGEGISDDAQQTLIERSIAQLGA
ncbi:F0F1 ATP synthase subunit B [Anabaena sp. FACHB-1237]|uniref:F0F1 ATP synthase subunit B n=1 Tax=Anabaena sp. FACHB-1237 TaxID=2692769 RepID=UPI0016803560|nr:F0F1 ATP synthase subunit B [Anabaena sp. FACHB-1237]MBD2136609.1 F0F1 ATP synthase subunit B [Anabaena sp. FACHB-1237]